MLIRNSWLCRARVVAAVGLLSVFSQPALAQSLDTSSIAPSAPKPKPVAPQPSVTPRGDGDNPVQGANNDNCLNAIGIGEGTFPFSLVGATNDYPGTCGQTTAAGDKWWAYFPSGPGTATWSTCSSTTLDTVMTVLQACGGPQIICLDDSCGLQTRVNFSVIPGNMYLLRLAGFNGAVGSGSFTITRNPNSPPNDGCSAAALILPGLIPFDTTNATVDGTASCGTSNATPDVWFAYAATSTGTVTVESCGLASYDTVLSTYSACGVPGFVCNDDACGQQSSISFAVVPGVTYLIRVSGFNGAVGAGSLRLTLGPPCGFAHLPFAVPEPEGCGQNTNPGCSQPPMYTEVSCDTTFAGYSWATNGTRDTDWYRVNVAAETPVTVLLQSAFPSVLFAFSEACPPSITYFTDASCQRDGILEFVASGPTVVFVSTGSLDGPLYNGLPCGPASTNGYNLTIMFGNPCGQPCRCDWNHSGSVTSQDFFDFLVGFFSGNADFNTDGQTTSQDFFDFLVCFFNGCAPICDFQSVRDAVVNPQDDPPQIQANYDMTDTAFFLYGNIPFSRLFASRPIDLLPEVQRNLSRLQTCTGLTVNRGQILSAMYHLVAVSGTYSVGDLITLAPDEAPSVAAALQTLCNLGVPIPPPSTTSENAFARRLNMIDLMTQTPNLRVRDLFFYSRSDVTPIQFTTVQTGVIVGCLFCGSSKNDKCCADGCDITTLNHCKTRTDKDCYLKPGDRNGNCSTCTIIVTEECR